MRPVSLNCSNTTLQKLNGCDKEKWFPGFYKNTNTFKEIVVQEYL
jgi:hypothetical protein